MWGVPAALGAAGGVRSWCCDAGDDAAGADAVGGDAGDDSEDAAREGCDGSATADQTDAELPPLCSVSTKRE